jgi:nucleoside-diphosphate-sugar epimerase
MKVLYIGGTGEISYACVMSSLQKGHEVTVFNRGQRASLPTGVRHVQGDLHDKMAYQALSGERFDTVCQFLAFTPDTIDRDIAYFAGQCGQYVFISTASAYRKPAAGEPITELTPLENPFWEYSRRKAECEQRLLAADGFPVTVIRPSHTYRERVPSTVVAGDHLVWRLQRGKPVVVHDDGQSLWTLTHAYDFADAFTGLFGERRALGDAFHITSSEAYSWNHILTCVANTLGCAIDLRPVPTSVLIDHNPGWEGPLRGDKANSLRFDNSKIQRLLPDWHCTTSLDAGVEMAVNRLLSLPGGIPEPDRQLDLLIDNLASAAA